MITNASLIEDINVKGLEQPIEVSLVKVKDVDGILEYNLQVRSEIEVNPKPITLEWKVPAINVKGVWKPTTDFNKRIQADWELDHMESRISIDAPVINLFGHDDSNVLTFACSNAINKLELNARIREEDNNFYCHITFFIEQNYPIKYFNTKIRLDYRKIHFSESLKDVSRWWEEFEALKPTHVPDIAKMPLYSTWYQFHQDLDCDVLLEECKMAYELGYKAVIIDDGWQTNDNNRGYDYTGDWEPDRIPNMKEYVAQVHATGMKIALWYSVPFCGKKSKAYKKFKGKFLTENHRWAPVFDPRYPEVREYLINIYSKALKEWNLDGFKLDFIDDFRLYVDTPTHKGDGRDYASINAAVDCLLTDVARALQEINPEVFIEFRQKYTGPAMRKYGNMFRAFDCPGDATMNRIRIADIKMLCGNTAPHSDMVTWHKDEPVEIAALQLINTLFGVPQLSIFLTKASEEEKKMIAFYTQYWNDNADTFMEGIFIPSKPLANYPIKRTIKGNTTIIGVYDNVIANLDNGSKTIHFLNGKIENELIINNKDDFGMYHCTIFNCQGVIVRTEKVHLIKGVLSLEVPSCGIVILKK
ncbi:glycoside hydrolase family 36 protein [uncultured Maribacter sp.]|uniref:glycoside hydrolase family 36 protein n=1 Tax=uncultured Maribacter sp. TaxID=431308 RepID=UPI002617823C|nr:glycoside hydrolase family 36 protein [uncultured Maribacter sp.]